jgi:vacuolar transporter chaperone complex subunit 2/3
VLRITYTRSAFQIPGDDSVRINLDHDIAMIREDALDEDRPCRDPNDWHRRDIDDSGQEYPFPHVRRGEICRFPFAVLEIKTAVKGEVQSEPKWVADLMRSHLVKETPRFSKYAHGASVLFENYVNLLPFWLSEVDDDIRKDPQQVYDEQEQERRAGGRRKVVWGPRESISAASGDAEDKQAESSEPKIPVTEAEPPREPRKQVQRQQSLFSLLRSSGSRTPIRLPPGVRKPASYLKNAGPVKVETKVWLANERTFIKWMHVSTLMATLSLALYNGAASVGNTLARDFGMVYLLLAVGSAVWAYVVYMYRSKEIRNRSPKHMDDRIGPLIVGIAIVIALVANFVFKV